MQIPAMTDEQIRKFVDLYEAGHIVTSADGTHVDWHARFGGWGMKGNTMREPYPGEDDVGVAYEPTRVFDCNELGAFRVRMPDASYSPYLLSRADWQRVCNLVKNRAKH